MRSQHSKSPPQEPRPASLHNARRRQSLPAHSSNAPRRNPAANGPPIPPASPEVISSLISSLSAISSPAQTHFESFPKIGSQTAPSSPSFCQTAFVQNDVDPQDEAAGLADYGAHAPISGDAEHDFLHPDDAAISPVVRMAKAPTSPHENRSRLPSSSTDAIPLRSSSIASRASSRTGRDYSSSFGVVSLEPGPRMSNVSIASSSSGGRKSLKSPFRFAKRESRDFTKDKDTDWPRPGELRMSSSRSRLSLRSAHSMADLVGEDSISALNPGQFDHSGLHDPRRDSAPSLSSINHRLDTPTHSPGGIGSGRLIPTRESSLRNSHSRNSSKHRSARYSAYSHRDSLIDRGITEVKSEDDHITPPVGEGRKSHKEDKDQLLSEDKTSSPRPSVGRLGSLSTPSSAPPSSPAHQQFVALDQPLRKVDEVPGDIEGSAPSPTVLTRRVVSTGKRNAAPVNPVPGIAPANSRERYLDDAELSDQKKEKRRSRTLGPLENKGNHRRTRSSALSPAAPKASMSIDERPDTADSIDDAVSEYISSPKLTQKVTHPQTGRVIAFSEVGDPQGHVVFCCVGMGLTRLLTAFYDELARTLKLRLITPDRPGVGESEACMDGTGTPLSWPDDLAIICNSLKISKFSMLAHSAGAIYALATALRMPQHIRGRIHLLAPWIPPSQMTGMGTHKEPLPASALPYSQRILRALPTPILKVANSSFMTVTSASITSSLPKSSRRNKRKNAAAAKKSQDEQTDTPNNNDKSSKPTTRPSNEHPPQDSEGHNALGPINSKADSDPIAAAQAEKDRQTDYDSRLTHTIWDLATTNANPAVDLLICLERRQTIGFRYVDINRAVVIHHGSRDTRVPVDNVRWLGKTMRRCEVRVLEGEGHGLMASATVMGNVLTEIAKEWEDWTTIVRGRRDGGRRATVTAD